MKKSEIVVGGVYSNGKTERSVVEISEDGVLYLALFGLFSICSLAAFARWAKERIA